MPKTFSPLAASVILGALYGVVVLGAGATAALCFFAGY